MQLVPFPNLLSLFNPFFPIFSPDKAIPFNCHLPGCPLQFILYHFWSLVLVIFSPKLIKISFLLIVFTSCCLLSINPPHGSSQMWHGRSWHACDPVHKLTLSLQWEMPMIASRMENSVRSMDCRLSTPSSLNWIFKHTSHRMEELWVSLLIPALGRESGGCRQVECLKELREGWAIHLQTFLQPHQSDKSSLLLWERNQKEVERGWGGFCCFPPEDGVEVWGVGSK